MVGFLASAAGAGGGGAAAVLADLLPDEPLVDEGGPSELRQHQPRHEHHLHMVPNRHPSPPDPNHERRSGRESFDEKLLQIWKRRRERGGKSTSGERARPPSPSRSGTSTGSSRQAIARRRPSRGSRWPAPTRTCQIRHQNLLRGRKTKGRMVSSYNGYSRVIPGLQISETRRE